MQFKLKLFFIFIFSLAFGSSLNSYAQKASSINRDSIAAVRQHIQDSLKEAQALANKARQRSIDSARKARQHILDSTATARQGALELAKEARKRFIDSMNLARKERLDSMHNVRKHFTDSLNAIRKYKESRHYRDSVTRSRTAIANLLKAKRQAYIDSLTAARKHVIDSVNHIRQVAIAAMRAVQKRRTDSMERIRKYKESRRYRDSVTVFKKARLDSMMRYRKHFADSVIAYRKHFSDSLAKARKIIAENLQAQRNKRMDSLKDARKKRADSLMAVKTKHMNALKAEQKKKEQKTQFALEAKIKKKHEAWSNEQMLKKKWSLKRKIVQNTFTRYNYYYNANRKMDEALANMQRIRRDNYDSLIDLYPFDPNRDSTILSSDMDSILHKVSVGIQIHDPRVKWDDDLYLLMGQADYYKGRYNDAGTAFHYIISMDEQRKKKGQQQKDKKETSIVETDKKTMLDFLKHKSVHNEAILWLSRTFTESNQPEKSESVLALLEADSNLPKNLLGKVALERAFLALKENNYKEASKQLALAANDKYLPDWLRLRSAYLNGELLQRQGMYTASAEAFATVLDLGPKIDMDFYSRKYMALNTMYAGNDPKDAISTLKKVLDDGKYISYYEQIYYLLGVISANGADYANAETYLNKGLHVYKTTKKQKAISFAELGNIYYATGDYIAAKHAYDSASLLASHAPNDSLVMLAVLRSKALNDLTGPATILHDQDSLLALAKMSGREQRNIVRKYLKHLQELRDDSIFRAENAGVTSAAATEPGEENAGGGWYFSNPMLMQQGSNEFKRKWGNRPNVDNWRRNSALTFAATSNNNAGLNNTGANLEGNPNLDESGLPTEEYLLACIPTNPDQQAKAYVLIQKAYVDMADAYIRKLDDYTLALKALDTMDQRFPSNDMQARVIYLRYIIALRMHDFDKAKQYSQQLMNDYPATEYAKLVKPSEDGANMPNPAGITADSFYQQTYRMLLDRQYNEVLIRVVQARSLYRIPRYTQQFTLLRAMALAGQQEYGKADTALNEFFMFKPTDSLKAIGEAVRNYIARYKPPPAAQPTTKGSTNNVSGINKTLNSGNAPSSDTTTGSKSNNNTINPNTGQSNSSGGYIYAPNSKHFCVIALPGLDTRALGIKAAVTDFNTFKFSSSGLSLNMDVLTPQQSLLAIKSFNNAADAKNYMISLESKSEIFRDYKTQEYSIFIISASNYIQLFVDHTITTYMGFYRANYR